MVGVETWGKARKTLIDSNVQKIQNKVTQLTVPKAHMFKSSHQRENILNWRSVKDEVTLATHSLTYRILNLGIPQEILSVMPQNVKYMIIKSHKKLDTKQKWLGNMAISRSTYRN